MILDSRYNFANTVPKTWKLNIPKLDIPFVQAEYEKFILTTPFTEKNQINFTSMSEQEQDPYEGAGSLYSRQEGRSITKESQYKFFIKKFENTFFHALYKQVSEVSPLPIGRVRLMKLKPKTCYSFHRDNSIRYHLAINTNPECYLLFKDSGLFHVPMDGQIYGTNTLLEHTAMNCSDQERIHLVFSTAWTPDAEERLSVF